MCDTIGPGCVALTALATSRSSAPSSAWPSLPDLRKCELSTSRSITARFVASSPPEDACCLTSFAISIVFSSLRLFHCVRVIGSGTLVMSDDSTMPTGPATIVAMSAAMQGERHTVERGETAVNKTAFPGLPSLQLRGSFFECVFAHLGRALCRGYR